MREGMLRALMVVYAVAALSFAVVWAVDSVELFDPHFNEARALDGELLIVQALIAFLGVPATVTVSVAALAFARSGDRRWVVRVGVSTICALTLLAAWLALAAPAGSR